MDAVEFWPRDLTPSHPSRENPGRKNDVNTALTPRIACQKLHGPLSCAFVLRQVLELLSLAFWAQPSPRAAWQQQKAQAVLERNLSPELRVRSQIRTAKAW